MKRVFDRTFKQYIILLGQGEYYTTRKDELIATVLGSCVAICLMDKKNKIFGMNHYLLPEPVMEDSDSINFSKAKYGINAIEMMVNDMLKLGAEKSYLVAKIFGGANMFNFGIQKSNIPVGQQNVLFAKKYLSLENIFIESSDVLGTDARKIYLSTSTGKVNLFRLNKEDGNTVVSQEKLFKSKIKKTDEKFKTTIDSLEDDNDKITFF